MALVLALLAGTAPLSPALAAKKPAPRPAARPPAATAKKKSPSPTASKDFQRYLRAAARLYEDLEYESALAQLKRARRLASNVMEDVSVALYEGVILADMGRAEEARASFRMALLLKPEATLPVRVSPKVEGEFEGVRARVHKELALDKQPQPAEPVAQQDTPAPAVPGTSPEPSGAPTETPVDRPALKPEPDSATVKLVPPPPAEPSPVLAPVVAKPSGSRVPVLPVVLAGASVVAGGAGAFLGVTSRNQLSEARQSFYADESSARLAQAQGSARAANVLLGTAGLAAVGAVVTWWLSPSAPVASVEAEPSAK